MRRQANRGFTLIELAIVISLVGILALIAVPVISQLLPRYRLNRTVREFCDHLQMARLLAISENVEYRVCITERDYDPTNSNITTNKGGYTISAGNRSSGSTKWDILPIGEGEDEGTIRFATVENHHDYTGVSLTETLPEALGGSGLGNSDCLVYSPRGWISNVLTDFRWNYVQIQFRNKAANPREDVRWVQITRGGITRIRTTSRGSTESGDTL